MRQPRENARCLPGRFPVISCKRASSRSRNSFVTGVPLSGELGFAGFRFIFVDY